MNDNVNPWSKKKGLFKGIRYQTTLTPMEREIVGMMAAIVADDLIERCQTAPRDELAELTGMPSGHKDAPTKPELARLLPDFERDGDEEYEGDNQLLRSLHEQDICRAKINNLSLVTDALGPDGSVTIAIEPADVQGWLSAFNDMRLYLSAAETNYPLEEEDARMLSDWLGYRQESLLELIMDDLDDSGADDPL